MDSKIKPEFSATIPKELEQGKLYISIECKIAVHKCCCGCGAKVHTPLTPRDWEIIYDGKHVSLYPSIGGWNAGCQSHYIISMNKVVWAGTMSRKKIEEGRAKRRRGAPSMTERETRNWRKKFGRRREEIEDE